MNHFLVISSLLLVVALAGGCSSAAHFRVHGDPESLWATLHNEVVPGDSIDKVQKLLGPGRIIVSSTERDRVLTILRRFATRHPDEYPDGVRDNDTLVEYRYDKLGIHYLQFRDGRLINFDPEEFAKYEPSFVIMPLEP